MNKEEFIGKLQMVYVGDRNAFNEIVDIYDELKGDNKHLNDLLDGALKEYDRLNNIINGLEKYIGQEWYCFDNESNEFKVARDILDKLKELKENNNV